MPTVADVFREARERYGTRKAVSALLGASERTIESYERSQRPIPEDIISRAAHLFNRPEISIIKCFQCEAGFLKVPYLDLVDEHPVAVKCKTIEEMKEAILMLEAIDFINKNSAESLTESEMKKIDLALEQLLDVLPAITMLLVVLTTVYQIDLKQANRKHSAKMTDRQYLSISSKKKKPAEASY